MCWLLQQLHKYRPFSHVNSNDFAFFTFSVNRMSLGFFTKFDLMILSMRTFSFFFFSLAFTALTTTLVVSVLQNNGNWFDYMFGLAFSFWDFYHNSLLLPLMINSIDSIYTRNDYCFSLSFNVDSYTMSSHFSFRFRNKSSIRVRCKSETKIKWK